MGLLRALTALMQAKRALDPNDLYQWVTGSKASITAQAAIRRRYCLSAPELDQLAVKHAAPSQARVPHAAAVCDQTDSRMFSNANEPWLDEQCNNAFSLRPVRKARQTLHRAKIQ